MKLKFTPKVALIAAAFLLFSMSSYAQLTRELHVSRIDNTMSDTATFSLWGKNLTNLSDFQFSVDWDTTQLTYVAASYTLPTTALGLTGGDLNFAKKAKVGTTISGFGIAHYDATLLGQSVADSTILMTFKLRFTNGYSKSVIDSVRFGDYPTAFAPIDTTDGNYNPPGNVPSMLYNGYVSTPFPTFITNGGNGVLVANNTPSTAPPASYTWYTVTSSGPGGPGTSYTYTVVPGSTSNQILGVAGVTYAVVANYASGAKDTSGTALPVRLMNFKGKNMNNTNVLSWVTATETNSAEFAIERSSNGETFTQVGTVKAAGVSTNEKAYNYTDAGFTSFTNYYRLRMVDENGAFSYSNVVKLNKQGKAVFQILPNPIENSTVNVYGSNMKLANVYNVNGSLLISQAITSPEHAALKVNNLAKGVYVIKVTAVDGQTQTEKFIIK